MDAKKTLDFEFSRQVFHLLLGVAAVLMLEYGFLDKGILLALAIIGLAISYTSTKIQIPLIHYLLQRFEREQDLKRFPGKGIIFYFFGMYLSLLLFPQEIAMASIMILALGDSISHLYGLNYGRIRYPLSKTKFLEGTIAGFAAGFLGALIFLPWHQAFLASFAAMIVEAIEIKVGANQVDDNLVVPVVAGAVAWAFRG